MSATNALEHGEDLEIVALVRMEDVQPARSIEVISKPCTETVGSNNDFILNEDEDSNIGSMVSIKSEDIVEWQQDEDSDNSESIESDSDPLQLNEDQPKPKESDRWPTLEILPGGVIKNVNKYQDDLFSCQLTDKNKNNVSMYACAKCPDSFDSLLLLVKHVRSHEEEKKKDKDNQISAHINQSPVQTCKRKIITDLKTKCKVPKKA